MTFDSLRTMGQHFQLQLPPLNRSLCETKVSGFFLCHDFHNFCKKAFCTKLLPLCKINVSPPHTHPFIKLNTASKKSWGWWLAKTQKVIQCYFFISICQKKFPPCCAFPTNVQKPVWKMHKNLSKMEKKRFYNFAIMVEMVLAQIHSVHGNESSQDVHP